MIWTADIASACFWTLAVLSVAVSFGLVFKLRSIPKGVFSSAHFKVASGQRKDNWLLSGVVWGALFMRPWEGIDAYFMLSLPVLVWLLHRAAQRLRALSR